MNLLVSLQHELVVWFCLQLVIAISTDESLYLFSSFSCSNTCLQRNNLLPRISKQKV